MGELAGPIGAMLAIAVAAGMGSWWLARDRRMAIGLALAAAVISISLQGQGDGFLPLPGDRHAVAVLGFGPEGRVDIGDPFTGRQEWSMEQLGEVWTGEAIALQRP